MSPVTKLKTQEQDMPEITPLAVAFGQATFMTDEEIADAWAYSVQVSRLMHATGQPMPAQDIYGAVLEAVEKHRRGCAG